MLPSDSEVGDGRMSDEQFWSYAVTIVGVTGFILAGRNVWWAWWINVGCQGLWVALAFATGLYAFLISSAIYTPIFVMNAVRWTRKHREEEFEARYERRQNFERTMENGP